MSKFVDEFDTGIALTIYQIINYLSSDEELAFATTNLITRFFTEDPDTLDQAQCSNEGFLLCSGMRPHTDKLSPNYSALCVLQNDGFAVLGKEFQSGDGFILDLHKFHDCTSVRSEVDYFIALFVDSNKILSPAEIIPRFQVMAQAIRDRQFNKFYKWEQNND